MPRTPVPPKRGDIVKVNTLLFLQESVTTYLVAFDGLPIEVEKWQLITMLQPTVMDCVEMSDFLERLDLTAPATPTALFLKAKAYGFEEPAYFGKLPNNNNTVSKYLPYLVLFLYWLLLIFVVLGLPLFFSSCSGGVGDTRKEPNCKYVVVHNTYLSDTLTYIPKTISGNYDYSQAFILLPNTYKQIKLYYGSFEHKHTVTCYVLNSDLPRLCKLEDAILMDCNSTFLYSRAKSVLKKYAEISAVMAKSDTLYRKILLNLDNSLK